MSTVPTQEAESRSWFRRRRWICVIAVMMIAALAVLAGVMWYHNWALGPLIGETEHDFGILLRDESGRAIGNCAFTLKNRSDEAVLIRDARASCGCTTVSLKEVSVPTGGTITIPVQFKLSRDGIKKETVKLLIDGHGVKTLHVRGEARLAKPLFVKDDQVQMQPGSSACNALYVNMYDSDEPPRAVIVDSPGYVEIGVASWKKLNARTPGKGLPALWTAAVEIAVADDAEPGPAVVEMMGGRELFATLVIDVTSPATQPAVEPENPAE